MGQDETAVSFRPVDARCRRVELVLSDVDGVLTDGGILFDNQGIEQKRFHVRDDDRVWWVGAETLEPSDGADRRLQLNASTEPPARRVSRA